MPQLFDTDSEFGSGLFELLQEAGERVEIKASFFMNELEGDIIGFESVRNLYDPSEYRAVESVDQIRSVYALIFQNIAQIESQCDLKNIFEMSHIVISFKVKDSEFNFISFPVFPKNLKSSEIYAAWIQFKNLLKNPEARLGANGTPILKIFKSSLPSSKLCFLSFIESSPDKFTQASLLLEEHQKLQLECGLTEKKKLDDQSFPNSLRRPSERSSHFIEDDSQQESGLKDLVQEVNEFIVQSEGLFVSFCHLGFS